MMYNIPNDSPKLRRKVFMQLMTPDPETGYMDGEDYGLLRPYIKQYCLTVESRLWRAFLYGMSYSCTTVIRFLQKFPELSRVKPEALHNFWRDNKPTLYFAPDKRYLKNNDQVCAAIRSIYKLSRGNLSAYLIPLLDKGFDATYHEIVSKWKYFGPSGAYLFFDAIYAFVTDKYTDPAQLDWVHSGKTVRDGMAHLLCDDDAVETDIHDYAKYNHYVDLIVKKTGSPKIVVESNLCFFRKLFKATRYLGYYADRQLVECHQTADILKESCGVDIWEYRELTVPTYLRGEANNWTGIRKEKYKTFLLTGKLE